MNLSNSTTMSEPRLHAIKNRLDKLNMEANEIAYGIQGKANSIYNYAKPVPSGELLSKQPEPMCIVDDIELSLNRYAEIVRMLQETHTHLNQIV